jgi:thiosulfate/3-mercaptopyruvate sulfurtransferase
MDIIVFSYKKVCMLNGGFEKWKNDGHPIEIKCNSLSHSKFSGKINKEILPTAEEIKRSLETKNMAIIDARSKEEFSGVDVRAARRGHIPLAVNIDWESNIQNGTFKDITKLSKIYSKIQKNAKVITYCQGGYRAANSFVVLKMLGYKKVKMYLGSWGEWGNRINFPVSEGN